MSTASTQSGQKIFQKVSFDDSNVFHETAPSVTHKLSRNISNDEFPDNESVISDSATPGQREDLARAHAVIKKSRAYLAEKDVDYMKSQNRIHEKEIKKGLVAFFKDLEETFKKEKAMEKSFKPNVVSYIQMKSDGATNEAKPIQESDSLVWKCLKLVDKLAALSQRPIEKNEDKLKLYTTILASQLGVQNHKYMETRRNIMKGVQEKKILELCSEKDLENQNRWLQIDKSSTASKIVININSVKNLKYRSKAESHNWVCVIKADGIECGRTSVVSGRTSMVSESVNPSWEESIKINVAPDLLFEILSIEIYECSKTPILIGECCMSLNEVIENTLVKDKYSTQLPIIPPTHNSCTAEPRNSELSNRQERFSAMTENEFSDYLHSALNERENVGLLRASFAVIFDPSFTDIVKEVKQQRLENIDAWAEENRMHLEDQLEFLKFSIAPINTLEIDTSLGIKVKAEEVKKLRDIDFGCGLCSAGSNNNCNLF